MRFLAATALAAMTLAATTHAQPDRARTIAPALKPDATLRFELTRKVVVSQGESLSQLVQGATLSFHVREVDEQGVASIAVDIERLSLVWADSEGQLESNWSADSGARSEDASPLDELAQAIGSADIAIRVAADGRIRAVAGLDDAMQTALTSQRLGPRGLGLFLPNQFAAALEPIWRADGLTRAPRRAGGGWQETQAVPIGAAGEMTFITDMVVTELNERTASYEGNELVEVARPATASDVTPGVEVVSHEGSVRGVWSFERKAIESRTFKRRMATRWTLGDLSIAQTQEVSDTIEAR